MISLFWLTASCTKLQLYFSWDCWDWSYPTLISVMVSSGWYLVLVLHGLLLIPCPFVNRFSTFPCPDCYKRGAWEKLQMLSCLISTAGNACSWRKHSDCSLSSSLMLQSPVMSDHVVLNPGRGLCSGPGEGCDLLPSPLLDVWLWVKWDDTHGSPEQLLLRSWLNTTDEQRLQTRSFETSGKF